MYTCQLEYHIGPPVCSESARDQSNWLLYGHFLTWMGKKVGRLPKTAMKIFPIFLFFSSLIFENNYLRYSAAAALASGWMSQPWASIRQTSSFNMWTICHLPQPWFSSRVQYSPDYLRLQCSQSGWEKVEDVSLKHDPLQDMNLCHHLL